MTIAVGDWARRNKPGRITRIHLVESLVAGDIVTKCGKRLRDELGGLEHVSPALWGRCRLCDR